MHVISPPGQTISCEKSRTTLSPILLFLLKPFEITKFVSPLFSSLLGHRCVSLHMCVGAFRCGQSTPCPPPSDWWRMTCMPWCLYPIGELTTGYVHIAVYTAYHSFILLVEANHMQILCTLLRNFISNNRPIKGIDKLN